MSKYDEKKVLFLTAVGRIFAYIAGIFLIVASCVMFANICTRTAADINIRVVYELCQLCGAGVASFAVPYATICHAHTEMDIVTSHMNERLRNLLGGISGIITIVIMVFTVYMLCTYAYNRTLVLEATTTNHLPMYIFRWTYAFGMACTTIVAAFDMIDCFRVAMGKKVIHDKAEYDAYIAEHGGADK